MRMKSLITQLLEDIEDKFYKKMDDIKEIVRKGTAVIPTPHRNYELETL